MTSSVPIPPLERMNSGSERTHSNSSMTTITTTTVQTTTTTDNSDELKKQQPLSQQSPSSSTAAASSSSTVPLPVVLLTLVLSTWISFQAGQELREYPLVQHYYSQIITKSNATTSDAEWTPPNLSSLNVHQDHWTEHSEQQQQPTTMPNTQHHTQECRVNDVGETVCEQVVEQDDDDEDDDDEEDEDEDEEEEEEVVEPRYAEHLVADIQYVETDFLNSQERLIQAMKTSAKEANTVLEAHYCFSMEPMGVSCAGELANEGRITFHTWPAEGVITMDLLTFDRDSPLPTPERVRQIYGVPADAARPSQIVWFTRSRGKTAGSLASLANNDDLNDVLAHRIFEKTKIASVTSAFQTVDVYDVHGQVRDNIPISKHIWSNVERDDRVERQVFLDGAIQSREFGEAAYHEALVHPALLLHPNPQRVAIVGGGEGATLREVLKHSSVKTAVMVEIDEIMVNTSRTHLPDWSDCSNLVGGYDSCFDDPRAEVYYQDAIAWFVDRFADNDHVERDQGFDVIIMDALDPSTIVEFSDFLYTNERLAKAFSNALGEQGILVAQVGTEGTLGDVPESLDADDLEPLFRKWLEQAGFESMLHYQEAHSRFSAPWQYLLAMKDGDFRARWHASEAFWNLEIQHRLKRTVDGDVPLRFFDSGTMMSYQYPTRVSEHLWCLDKPDECEDYKPRFDPELNDIPVSEFSIQDSKIPNAGRGVFARRFIPKGSLMGAGECVHGMFVPPLTHEILDDTRNALLPQPHEYFENLRIGYIEGYGWAEQYYGHEAAAVDPGILTFMNHGCHGTHNSGPSLPFTESSVQNSDDDDKAAPAPTFIEYYEFYNPYHERRYSFPDCSGNLALRDIEAGEEVLCNYLVLEGAFHGEEGRQFLDQVNRICEGQETWTVTEYEQQQQASSQEQQ